MAAKGWSWKAGEAAPAKSHEGIEAPASGDGSPMGTSALHGRMREAKGRIDELRAAHEAHRAASAARRAQVERARTDHRAALARMSPEVRAKVDEAERLRPKLRESFTGVHLVQAIQRAKEGSTADLDALLPRARARLQRKEEADYAKGKTPEGLMREHAELSRLLASKSRSPQERADAARRMRLVAGAYEALTDQPIRGKRRRIETA